MHTPQGYRIVDGRVVRTDWLEVTDITDGANSGTEWFAVGKAGLADPDLDRQHRGAGCVGLGHSAADGRRRVNP